MTDAKSYLQKLRLLGVGIDLIKQSDGSVIYMSNLQEENRLIIIIPDNVKEWRFQEKTWSFARGTSIDTNRSVIKVVGGSGLLSAREMFIHWKARELDLSDFNTSKVQDMTEMFSYCESEKINISNLDTSNVVYMDYMFSYCTAKSLDVSNFNTSKVQSMLGMFQMCEAEELDLMSFDTSNVTDFDDMFEDINSKVKTKDPLLLKAYKEQRS